MPPNAPAAAHQQSRSAPPAAKPAPTVVPVQPAKPATPPAEPKAAAPVADETFEITVAGEKRKMTKAELSDLMTLIEAWGAENGVVFNREAEAS